MAVPKKRLSKSKTQLRKTKWRVKALEQAKKAFARSLSQFKKPSYGSQGSSLASEKTTESE